VGAEDVVFRIPPAYHVGGGSGTAQILTVSGQFFRNRGALWTGIQTSEFSLPKRWLAGEEVRPILDERVALGFNEVRGWLLNQSVVGQVYPEGIHPNQYPDFYARIRALVELLGTYGMVAELTVFTSCNPLMRDPDDQHRHWLATMDCVTGLGNVRLELVNEWDWGAGENCPDHSLFSMRPQGILSSSGSSTADAPPPTPIWDYVCYHSNGLNEWQRKVGHNTMEWADAYHVPGCANENMRYPDDDNSEAHAYDAAAGAALLCASACFHSQGGKYSRPFDAVEKAAAAKWCEGARSVPLEFQAGVYHHRTDLEGDGILRAYDRQLPDGRAHVVLIRE
jgi:hypothetical protein